VAIRLSDDGTGALPLLLITVVGHAATISAGDWGTGSVEWVAGQGDGGFDASAAGRCVAR
jgi:hypothetical protein